MTKDGVGSGTVCPYDVENLDDAGASIMASISPKLRKDVVKGGTGVIDRMTALYRILDDWQSSELTEMTVEISAIKKLSLKSSATQDVTTLVNKVTKHLNALD